METNKLHTDFEIKVLIRPRDALCQIDIMFCFEANKI